MATDILRQVRVSGIACCVPEPVVRIDDFREELGEKEIKKFKRATGVQQKHCCNRDAVITAGDLCCAAAEKLLTELDIDKQSIDGVIFITQSPDYRRPATACVLQYRLGLREDSLALDINLGCSGYPYGLHLAGAYLQAGHLKKILLLAGEASVHRAPVHNRLFGEAGSATLLEYDPAQEDKTFLLRTMGKGFRHLISPYGGARHGTDPRMVGTKDGEAGYGSDMDGIEVFNFSTKEVPILLEDYMSRFEHKKEDFDLFAFHQANKMILQQIILKAGLPKDKCPMCLDIYGNTSSSSVPLAICDYFQRINPEANTEDTKHIAVCGYGVGLSLGICDFTIPGSRCFPVFTTTEAFEDGVL